MAITTLSTTSSDAALDRDRRAVAFERPSGLERRHVADAMSAGLITCDAATSVRVVAGIMAEARIHCVVVEDLGDRDRPAWGLISDLDLVAATAPGAADRTAAEVAATEVIAVATDETLEHAAQLMAEHELTHLIAVDPVGGRPVGILSSLDIAAALAGPPAAWPHSP